MADPAANSSGSGNGRLGRLEAELGELREATVEYRVRLENGSKVFSKYDERICKIEERTTPKPPSVLKIVALTLSLFVTAAGALWGLAQMLRDRPTMEQMDQLLDRKDAQHESVGHQPLRDDIRSIQSVQATQGVLIKDVSTAQTVQGGKLDELLKRIPVKRR